MIKKIVILILAIAFSTPAVQGGSYAEMAKTHALWLIDGKLALLWSKAPNINTHYDIVSARLANFGELAYEDNIVPKSLILDDVDLIGTNSGNILACRRGIFYKIIPTASGADVTVIPSAENYRLENVRSFSASKYHIVTTSPWKIAIIILGIAIATVSFCYLRKRLKVRPKSR